MVSVQKFYDYLSSIYPIIDVFLFSQKIKLAKEVNRSPKGKLLEVGVGNGSILPLYEEHEVIAIDLSRGMLDSAQKNNKNLSNVSFIQMDASELSFTDHMFDYVVLSHVIAVVANCEKMLSEVHRVLKPNGKLFVLNHFTPCNTLRYVDKVCSVFSHLLHFRSIQDDKQFFDQNLFQVVKTIDLGKLSYFKIIVLRKI